MKEKKVKNMFEQLLQQVNEIKRPALEFHHEDILGRLDDVEKTQARIEAKLDILKDLILDKETQARTETKLDILKDLILDKRDFTFRNVTSESDVLGEK